MQEQKITTAIQEKDLNNLKTSKKPIILPKDMIIAGLQAESIIAEAEIKATQILENAQMQSKKMFIEAQEFGYQKGIEEVTELIIKANQYNSRILNQNEINLIELSVDIAEKIIRKQLDLYPETIVHIVKDCLRKFFDQTRIDIKLNKDNIVYFNSKIDELKELLSFPEELKIVVDEDVHPDSCLVVTPIGKIEMNVHAQLNILKNILYKSFNNELGRRE